ncbi:hypothetical protein [Patulibacter defluvii]|uniref:hypothetical protein n=1 Tax=Patulibacter defluvii TaxID=3095358 RepID=UPI002A762826|nr:hypothetical protein [Patulibacter sp. DM4]
MTYTEIAREIKAVPDLEAKDERLDEILTRVARSEYKQRRGLVSVIVVRADSGQPGEGFFRLAREFYPDVGLSDYQIFEIEKRRVYDAARTHGDDE